MTTNENPLGHPGGKWMDAREWTAVALLLLLFAFGFTLESPVNGYFQHYRDHVADGEDEIFDQDSRFILDSLVENWHFLFNPQHHLLYHVLTEGIYKRGIRAHVQHGPESAYAFLKLFTVLTGAAFLLAMSRLLWELGVPPWPRILLLFLSGISVSGWFNFSAFETHSIGMPAIALYLLAILRLSRSERFGPKEQLLLGSSLVFLFLCRLDMVRFFAATALLVPLLPYRVHWKRITAVLAVAFLSGMLLYMPLISVYFKVPLREAPRVLFHREDDDKLKDVVATPRNLTPGNLAGMAVVTTVGTVIMPTGPGKFREPLAGATARPLFAITLLVYAAILGKTALALWKDRKNSAGLTAALLANWIAGILLYTWFNPREPFIWLLEFLPLILLAMGVWLRRADRKDWLLAGAGTLLVLANNLVYFYLPYRF